MVSCYGTGTAVSPHAMVSRSNPEASYFRVHVSGILFSPSDTKLVSVSDSQLARPQAELQGRFYSQNFQGFPEFHEISTKTIL
jgi:hypothetical protein